MIIDSINDTAELKSIDKDILGMTKAIAALKKKRALAKKVQAAFTEGRIDSTKRDAYIASLQTQIAEELFAIQSFGLALGSADENDWDHASDVVAAHYIAKATK
jgi:hypothetical protein